MDKKTRNFFRRSVCGVVVICALIFIWLIFFMEKRTEQSIADISTTYMAEMNLQIQQKFQTVIGLRMSQIEGIIERTPPETAEYNEEMLEELMTSASIRGFAYLGLCAENGEIETVYGQKLGIVDPHELMHSLEENGEIVMRASDAQGNKYLVLGVDAVYPMKSGGSSAALMVGLPMEYLNEELFLAEDESAVYFHIIDKNGNFVIRNADAYRENYFDRIRETYEPFENKSAEDYVMLFKESINTNEPYSEMVSIDGQKRNIYCAPLSDNSSWYLISVMPNNFMEEAVSQLDTMRIVIMLASMLVILGAMLIIVYLYYRLVQRQIKEVVVAREEAEQANLAKSEFLSSMSHDIRTPMNAIIGMTEIALKNVNDPMRVEDCLGKVRLSSKHLLGLINDVLDMSKIESGKMVLSVVPMSLRDAMDDIVNIMQPQVKAKNQYFDIFIQRIQTENVYCDGVRLNQVLLNLLSNAVKYTQEGGRIDVHVNQEPSEMGEDYVRTHFLVADTGIGMSQEFQEKIWDTFSREETDEVHHIVGAGLGMSITKRIVDLMGGTIELKSEKNQGSTFHVTIDLKKAEISEDSMKLPEWNILVVDDNKQLCDSAVDTLEELGVHAEGVLDGVKALQMIVERHNRKEDYHFVLVDWKMPGMDGIKMIHEIRDNVSKDLPVFLISAYDWSEIEEEISSVSIEGFISKPLFKSTLYERLRQYIEGYSNVKEEGTQDVDFSGKRILLAEDMDINWEVVSEILSIFGLELERAENGKECVEMFEKSEVGTYDAILMDIRMPIMNGYDATVAIRALNRPDNDLPIIAMTADAFSDDAQHCMEVGMDAHIPKPLDIKECTRILQKYLG